MGILFVYLVIIAIVTALAGVSIWKALKLLKDGDLTRRRKRVLIALLVIGVLLGLYGGVGPVRVGSETVFAGVPLPWAVLLRATNGMWIDYPSVYGGVLVFPPINFVFWVGLLVAPVNVVEGWRRRKRRSMQTPRKDEGDKCIPGE
jgi:hypothetical protein